MLRVLLPRLVAEKPPEALPVHFHARRIFILPTAYGLLFAGLLFVMLLGTLNFNNNLGLMLTFLLVASAVLSSVDAYRNLRGIVVTATRLSDCFAGETSTLTIAAFSPVGTGHYDIAVRVGEVEADAHIPEKGHAQWELAIPTTRRGRFCLPRISISTRYPLGLFRAWVWVESQPCAIVYPRPEPHPPPLPVSAHHNIGSPRQQQPNGDEEFDHLRQYRAGDSPGRVAWKHSATRGVWVSKQFVDDASTTINLRWQDLRGMEREHRLSRLTAWVNQARRDNLHFGLELPAFKAAPDHTQKHWHRCLRALGMYPDHAF